MFLVILQGSVPSTDLLGGIKPFRTFGADLGIETTDSGHVNLI